MCYFFVLMYIMHKVEATNERSMCCGVQEVIHASKWRMNHSTLSLSDIDSFSYITGECASSVSVAITNC